MYFLSLQPNRYFIVTYEFVYKCISHSLPGKRENSIFARGDAPTNIYKIILLHNNVLL